MRARTSLRPEEVKKISARLSEANQAFARRYPGESHRRQAVHTVYGGAHLFKADSAQKLGAAAIRSLEEYAPDAASLAHVLGMDADQELSEKLYARIIEKLRREPVEDFRLDFEDGYGNRADEEEDGHATASAAEVASGLDAKSLPPFLGIRIKPLSEDLRARSVRTLDIFVTTLLATTGGKLPEHFVITVPKIQLPEQMNAAVRFLEMFEKQNGLKAGALKIEPMIETPQAIINERGEVALGSLIDAAEGRCQSIHFGVYDYTASCGITAAYQTMRHPTCDFARQMMLVSTAGTGIHLSDGATNILPVGPHRASEGQSLTDDQLQQNREAVHGAWRLGFEDNMHSLRNGYYQGWDLHPAQFVTRYAAVYHFFLGSLPSASSRLKTFVEKAALASLHGDVFDDAATGQGLLNFFLRGIGCGAITESEALETGLTIEELRSRSFLKILESLVEAMSGALEFRLNGKPVRIDSISPNTTLLEWLRARGLTGSKEGCAEGDCGACSVAITDRDARGKRCYRAINSCLVPLPLMAGRDIVTVEGVAGEKMHPVQQAMVENFGSQCGYCTPGFIMSLFEAYYRKDLKTAAQLDEQLCGNLCRCTGYRPIRDAAADALTRRNGSDKFDEQLKTAKTKIGPARYLLDEEKFLRPTSLAKLFAAMAESPDGQLIAGATELGLEITKKFRKFPVLISIEAIPELTSISSTEREWTIGAATTLTRLDDTLGAEYPELREMLLLFGSRQIRNRATLGGNLVTASPIGDSAPVLLALDARVVIASASGERVLPIDDFFVSYRKTALQPGEILKSILLPRIPSDVRSIRRFYKVSKRREMDISTVAGAFVLRLTESGTIVHARLAYGGVAAMPMRARATEAALIGKRWRRESCDEVLPILEAEFAPISDVRGSATYRQELIKTLIRKFFADDEEAAPSKPIARWLPEREAALPHESAHKHVTGEAVYVDDRAQQEQMLEAWPVCSPHAHAKILSRDVSAARAVPGVRAVLLAEDVPGLNDVGAVRHDEILLADKEVFYHGQIVALVVGEKPEICRAAAEKVVVEYEPQPPIFTIEEAIAADSFHSEPHFVRRGDVASALRDAPRNFSGEFSFGGQDHFYLETNAAWAEVGEDGTIFISSSTQHPSEVQHIVAHVLALPMSSVVVECPRMGGGFGGKETQAAGLAALAALAATKTGRKARVRYNRDQDMMITGKRHPFLGKFAVGFDETGLLLAAKVELYSNGGWSLDLSRAVTDRAIFHLDNADHIPHVEFSGTVAKTNLASNTAFRGFGGPQGMLVMEEILDRVARATGLPPEEVRARNLYRGSGETNTTHYGQEIEDNRIQRVWQELSASSDFAARREQLPLWNAEHPNRKRGLAITSVKFGISFTTTHLNQAGALVLLYQDGTAQINHGGTEMGQGVNTNIALIAARELGVSPDRVRVMATRTDKVPNTSATAASCGTDLNGAAVKNACATLRQRLLPFAVQMLGQKNGRAVESDKVAFSENAVFDLGAPENQIPFAEILQRAYFARTSLSATGFYRTPDINYDREAGRGKPFHYFAVGAAVSEVEVDGFTGMHHIRLVDILHDAGDPVNLGVTQGQIEGGFVQGAGWLTCEELVWDAEGRLRTHSPDTYKIPAVGDTPDVFNVALLSNATQPNVIHGSKAVGEPPLMLAISVREAIRDAVAAFGAAGGQVPLASPATPEAIFTAIRSRTSSPRLAETTPEHQVAEQVIS